MKIFKPTWVSHDGNPIFSVDIHPDGTRFATGGQGPDKCGRVIIWNMVPLLDESQEMKDDVPKILCQMDNHLACINCVRWSSKGKYLASAGDDKSLMVWQSSGRLYNNQLMLGQNNPTFAPANFEQWRCITTLHGHGGDILDLAWSPNDSYLASCSVDNLIIIWDALNFPQVITKITGHTGLVKGVSWDPIGKYLASQSDDKTVRIWRTNDWREEVLIDEPFKECGGTTHVLRLAWSPDGQLLFSAHAMNNRGSTSQIIERDGWKAARDFVGHRKAITCVRPNPNILTYVRDKKQHTEQPSANSNSNGTKNYKQATSAKANKLLKYCCVAIGSRDRSLSVWLTNQTRPLTVAHDLFDSSVLDISWSPEGYHLIACSQDGSIAVIIFKKEELGQMLTQEEKLLHYQKLYGKSLVYNNSKKQLLVEDADLLKAQEDQKKRQKEIQEQLNHSSHSNSLSQNGYDNSHCKSGLGDNNNSLGGMSKGPTDKQIETLMPGGRRRITPLYIPPVINCDGSPLPFNANNSSITFSSSKESKTKIMIEVRDDSLSSTTNSPQKASSQPLPSTNNNKQISDNSPPRNLSQSPPLTSKPDIEHKQSQINGGQSLLVNRTSQSQQKQPHVTSENKNSNKNATSSGVKRKINSDVTQMTNKKGKCSRSSSQININPTQTKQVDQNVSFNTSRQTTEVQSSFQAANIKSTIQTTRKDPFYKSLVLPPLTIEKTADVTLVCTSDQTLTIEVENDFNSSKLSELRLLDQSNNRVWDILLPASACALMASESITAVSCSDHTLSIFSTLSGRRLRPPILLDSLVAHIAVESYHVMLITSNSNLWLWDFNTNRVIVRGETIMPLLTQPSQDRLVQRPVKLKMSEQDNNQQSVNQSSVNEIEILSCSLTELYQPLLILSTGRSLLYDSDLNCWTLLNDSNDLISKWSSQKSSISSIKRFLQSDAYSTQNSVSSNLKKTLPLASIQSQNTFDIRRYAQLLNKNQSTNSLQPKATSSFLDHQVAASLAINSAYEYLYWIIQSTKHFVDTGNEVRLRDLCSGLMSSTFGVDPPDGQTNETNSRFILGLDKKDILRDILSIVATDLRYQRIYTEYKQQLEYTGSNL